MYRMDKRNTTGHSVGRFLQFGMVYAAGTSADTPDEIAAQTCRARQINPLVVVLILAVSSVFTAFAAAFASASGEPEPSRRGG